MATAKLRRSCRRSSSSGARMRALPISRCALWHTLGPILLASTSGIHAPRKRRGLIQLSCGWVGPARTAEDGAVAHPGSGPSQWRARDGLNCGLCPVAPFGCVGNALGCRLGRSCSGQRTRQWACGVSGAVLRFVYLQCEPDIALRAGLGAQPAPTLANLG